MNPTNFPHEYLHVGRASDLTDPWDRRIYRALEIFPGLLAWITLMAVVFISFAAPIYAAIFIIAFDVYWLTKTIYLSLLMRSSFSKMRRNLQKNWLEKLEEIPVAAAALHNSTWLDIYHLVILPMSIEPLSVVRESFVGLTKINYPLDKMLVVLATEERVGEQAQEIARAIQEEFGGVFKSLLVTRHPDGLPGEIRGKGSNETWAGRAAKQDIVDPLRVPYEQVVVSVFDVDTVVPPDFFACLTWHYLTAPEPLHSSFQPIPLFINNIWEAPSFARVFAFSTTFWQMIQQSRAEQLITFSSHSLSLKPLVDIGFWQRNMVNEDSRIFWQCLLFYNGNWRTVPLHYPVYMDANVAPTFWQTVKNQYKQIRRWHYGAENNPYFLFGFMKNKLISLRTKWSFSFSTIERTHSSPTNALIIFFLGWLPLLVGGQAFSSSVLSYNLPRITSLIMDLSMLGLVTSAFLSVMLLPPRPPQYGKFSWVWMTLQWILFPINFIFFGAIPALDAQTRLALGKYLGFWVTPKDRTSVRGPSQT